MAGLSYKARKRWAIAILLVGLPVYIVAAVTVIGLVYPDPMDKPSILVELAIYVGLGVLWALPLKFIFKGIGKADPNAPTEE